MKILAYYMDGEVQEFDTQSSFVNSNLLGQSCGLTYLSLSFDNEKDGVWLRYRFYDVSHTMNVGNDGLPAPCPAVHSKYQLLDDEDLKRLAWIEMDGRRIVTRVGDTLVDNVKFEAYQTLYSALDADAPMNHKACDTFLALIGYEGTAPLVPREPDEDDGAYHSRVASLMGWSYDALLPLLNMYTSDDKQEEPEDESYGGDEDVI